MIAFPKDSAIQDSSAFLAKAQAIYKQVQEGADFGELAKEYSGDAASAKKGGVLPWFGEMVQPFEQAAFALSKPGDLSGVVETRFGYHIIKLIDKKGRPSFEEEEKALSRRMGQGERNFELYKAFDDRMKKTDTFSIRKPMRSCKRYVMIVSPRTRRFMRKRRI